MFRMKKGKGCAKGTTARTAPRRLTKEGIMPVGGFTGGLKASLDAWLEGRNEWDHNDWLGLLDNLRGAGYSEVVDAPGGHETIGRYLETNRKFNG